jgi:hypothetical protein
MRLFCCMVTYGTLGIFFAALSATALAQEGEPIDCKQIPESVMTVFKETYPTATVKGCAKEADDDKTLYEIGSVDGAVNRDVVYDQDGQVIVVEEPMDAGALPDAVQNAANKKAPKGKITLAKKLTRGELVSYELEITSTGKLEEIVFDPAGNELEP